MVFRRCKRFVVLLLALLVAIPQLQAAELDHYSPAIARPRDFLMPAPGNYYLQYNAYYTTDTYKDGNGHKVNSLTVGGSTLNLDTNVDSWMAVPTYLHVTHEKFLGANYGFYISQPLGNMSMEAALSTTTGRGISTSDSGFGLGDTFVQPLWLGWDLGDTSLAAGYGAYVPIGKYSAGAADNVGLGYWTHQFQAAAGHFWGPHHSTALTGALTYEINSNKEGTDVIPGQHLSFNAGADQMFPVSPKWVGNVGLAGYGTWQVSDDHGSSATRRNVHDQVYGLGLDLGLTYLPWFGQADLRWMHELQAEDRFEGDYYMLNFGMPF